MTGLLGWLRTGRLCPAGSALTRAASEGPGPRLRAHLERCTDCAAEYDSLRAISSELGALPEPSLRTEAFELIATALLDATRATRATRATNDGPTRVPTRSRHRTAPWVLSAALGCVLVVGGFWLARHRPRPLSQLAAQALTVNRAAIRAFGDARFGRVQPAPDETVRLDEGTLQLDVPALGPTETFRVLTMDGELRARATRFEVTAIGGRLERVRTWSGRVEIHSSRFAVTVLEAGDEWNRERPAQGPADVTAPEIPAPLPPRRRSPAVAARAIALLGARPAASVPVAAPQTPEQIRFDRAWALLRQGRAAESATAFAEAARRAHGTPLEEDALYWHAVALARAGDGRGAERELTAFIERFPRSSHGGEATVAVGWMLFEGGQATSARTFFERAAHDPSARVRQSALEGLQRTAP
jgi:TolA-binding protein